MRLRGIFREDLAWAFFLLILALGFGLVKHWGVVSLGVKGDLAGQLEKMRAQRRDKEFQGVKTVNLAQAYQFFQEGRTLFVDARKPEEYAELHVPGAVNIPPAKLPGKDSPEVANFAKDRNIVVYCGEVQCDKALKVAEKLQDLGFTRVQVFLGGFKAWDDAGYPADTSK